MKVEKIILEKDKREENLIRNQEGNIIGYKQSEYVCRVYFENGDSFWIPTNPELGKILKLISKNEDYKYQNGLGRNMFLLAYIYPVYKKYLKEQGFQPLTQDLRFAQEQARRVDPNYDNFLKEVEEDENKD